MKKRIGTIIIALLIAIVLCLNAFAVGFQTAQIYYNNIKIIIDGEEIIPKDVRGNVVEPFIMDGTTYLPVRAVSEALGMDVEWDGNTYTVFLTTPVEPPTPKPKTTYLGVDLKAYESQSSDFYKETSFKMLGDDYNGCTFYAGGYYSDGFGSAFYNLRGEYRSIKGTLGHVGSTDSSSGMFSIYLDGELYKEYPVTGNMSIQEVSIDVRGVQILKITLSIERGIWTKYGFGNVIVE